MSHYFGLLSVTYNAEGEKYPTFEELLDSVTLKHIQWLSLLSTHRALMIHLLILTFHDEAYMIC